MIADLFRPAAAASPGRQRAATVVTSPGVVAPGAGSIPSDTAAQKLSAVYAAVDLRANTMSVLPAFVMDTNTRERVRHTVLELLNGRPNEAMTPSVRKYLLERSVLLTGNAYDWILRDSMSGQPRELIPIPGNLVQVWLDRDRRPWYDVTDPVTGEVFRLPNEDVCHYKGPSRQGYVGDSVLTYARETLRAGLAAQEYNAQFYESGGQPAGVLTVDTDLSGYVLDKAGNPTDVTRKDALRAEWERVHAGPQNAHKIAILDLGLKYTPLAISQRDSQFVEQQDLTVLDICRFFGVPAYKLQAGKQSYNANEQNAIEYLSNIQPRVSQMEEEQTWKLLSASEQRRGLEVRYNMMSVLRSDSASRASYYKSMWECGAYSVNDILALEDMPDTPGGDEHNASLNYVPLSEWRKLSNLSKGGEGGDTE